MSVPGQNGTDPRAAISPGGHGVIVWQRTSGPHTQIQARALGADGSVSRVQTLSAAGQSADSAQVGIADDGDAIVAWQRFDGAHHRIQVTERPRSGARTAVHSLSPAGIDAFGPLLAVEPDGDALVVWSTATGVQARRRYATGERGPIMNVAAGGQMGIDAAGNAIFAWVAGSGGNESIQTRSLSAGGVLGPIHTTPVPGYSISDLRLAVGRAGDAAVAWKITTINDEGYRSSAIQAMAGP
jgi:hypothetical protein